MGPGFSERTFEFCYNAEYCQVHAALLAAYPNLPSQRQEKYLGYDVEFKISEGLFTKSVFLQHKVSFKATARAGKNTQFYDTHGGPYFRFPVDRVQHNTLRKLSVDWGNAFYCAPRFNLAPELELHFRTPSILDNSILLDPVDVDEITDNGRHNITYAPNGSNPTLHSVPRHFRKAFSGGKKDPPPLKTTTIDGIYVKELCDELVDQTQHSKYRRMATLEVLEKKPVEQIQFLLGHVYGVSWLLLP
jgi:hypothetical protein